jgi:uncharacterized protein (DUF924 family)
VRAAAAQPAALALKSPPPQPSQPQRALPRAQDVLLFWFGPKPYTAARIAQRSRLWFGNAAHPELTAQTDELIAERFGALLAAAGHGELDGWASGPRRRLALILLLDQFPRNVYRGTGRAFAQDDKALSLAVSGMQLGADAALDPLERMFFYMPLMHAESLQVQDESVAAFRRLLDEAPQELRSYFEGSLRYAQQHRELIERFGRFPHRNALVGRASTDVESDWLASGGERFGQ